MQTVMLRLDALIRRRRRCSSRAWALDRARRAAVRRAPVRPPHRRRLRRAGLAVGRRRSTRSSATSTRAQGATLAAVLVPHAGRDDRRAARARSRASTRRPATPATSRSRPPPARRRCASCARDGPRTLVVPLATDVGDSDAIDVAVDLRKQLGIADQPATRRSRTTSSARARCGPGMQDLSQGGPRAGRVDRLPDRAADPARRLRLARRGAAAGRARLRRRARHRRADLRALAGRPA